MSRGTGYRRDGDAIHDRIEQRVKRRGELERQALTAGGNCPRCAYYKRGIDGRCVNCGALWPLPKNNS